MDPKIEAFKIYDGILKTNNFWDLEQLFEDLIYLLKKILRAVSNNDQKLEKWVGVVFELSKGICAMPPPNTQLWRKVFDFSKKTRVFMLINNWTRKALLKCKVQNFQKNGFIALDKIKNEVLRFFMINTSPNDCIAAMRILLRECKMESVGLYENPLSFLEYSFRVPITDPTKDKYDSRFLMFFEYYRSFFEVLAGNRFPHLANIILQITDFTNSDNRFLYGFIANILLQFHQLKNENIKQVLKHFMDHKQKQREYLKELSETPKTFDVLKEEYKSKIINGCGMDCVFIELLSRVSPDEFWEFTGISLNVDNRMAVKTSTQQIFTFSSSVCLKCLYSRTTEHIVNNTQTNDERFSDEIRFRFDIIRTLNTYRSKYKQMISNKYLVQYYNFFLSDLMDRCIQKYSVQNPNKLLAIFGIIQDYIASTYMHFLGIPDYEAFTLLKSSYLVLCSKVNQVASRTNHGVFTINLDTIVDLCLKRGRDDIILRVLETMAAMLKISCVVVSGVDKNIAKISRRFNNPTNVAEDAQVQFYCLFCVGLKILNSFVKDKQAKVMQRVWLAKNQELRKMLCIGLVLACEASNVTIAFKFAEMLESANDKRYLILIGYLRLYRANAQIPPRLPTDIFKNTLFGSDDMFQLFSGVAKNIFDKNKNLAFYERMKQYPLKICEMNKDQRSVFENDVLLSAAHFILNILNKVITDLS
jgi:hypothetical protein